MAVVVSRLKAVLRQRRLQTHSAFCREYDKIAATIDTDLVGSAPGRAQFHRWLSGEVKGLPYPHHCRVLEYMLPGHTATELFAPDHTGTHHDASAALALTGRVETAKKTWRPGPLVAGIARPGPEAVVRWHADAEAGGLTQRLARLQTAEDLTCEEVGRLADLAGQIVDLDLSIDIDITADGGARVTYRYVTLNLTDQPLTRMFRELWFEHTAGALDITPLRDGTRRVAIHRIHDTPNLSKFSCQLSPALQPRESAVVGYVCCGGEFTDALYWRQSVYRYTRQLAINLRHAAAGEPTSCTATEEHPDGAENTATESLVWDCVEGDAVITVKREYLRPGQSITLRWKVVE